MKHPSPGFTPVEIKRSNLYASNPGFREYVDTWLETKNLLDAYSSELKVIISFLARDARPEVQSLAEGYQRDGNIDSSTVVKHENLTEIGGSETLEIKDGNNTITYINSDADLNDFFNRPIQIGTFSMAPGGTYENVYKVADLYLSNPAVRSKIRNFSFLRGTFVVRISVSGTPFDAGRILAAAYPFAGTNNVLSTLYTLGATWDVLKLQYMSQAKTATIIDLKENRPVDIELPFISPKPVARLFNKATTVIASGTSLDDFTNMWSLYMKTLNPMTSISASPSNVNVYVYAYMKDVQIGIPTGTQMDIVTQSKDERKTGPVQKVASNLLSITTKLHEAPYIGLYARASSFVLGGIKGVASLFGWSAPVIIEKPVRMKNEPYQNGANMIQFDTGQRLTIDPKQELAISTEYVASNKDELVISQMCEIQSFLNTFTWNASTAPLSPMWYIPIHPRLHYPYIGSPSGTYNVLPTPVAFASQAFGKWHGKMVITLEAVCSAFHRGKLAIVYEPNQSQISLVAANLDLNKQYLHVWDIQETQKYSICVDWNFPRPWANNLTDTQARFCASSNSYTAQDANYEALNGVLVIAPFTKLQSPDGSNISINIYVHAEDMQFNRFTQQYLPTSRSINYNCNIEEQSAVDTDSVSNIDTSCIEINPSTVATKDLSSHFYGESPISFRALLKRFVTTGLATATHGVANTPQTFSVTFPIYPAPTPTLISTTTITRSLWSHLRYAFFSMRGGVRKRFSMLANGSFIGTPVHVTLSIDSGSTIATTATITGLTSTTCIAQTDGTLKYVPSTNGGIEFEIPFYNNNYFCYSCNDDPFYTGIVTPMDTTYVCRNYVVDGVLPTNTSAYTAKFLEDTATAEDFQMSYFLGSVPYVG